MLFGDESYKSYRTVEIIVSINNQYPNDEESTVKGLETDMTLISPWGHFSSMTTLNSKCLFLHL